ncbi:hypothetical protein AAMO2058_000672900, partial [Amorphochlora amoebiformis]
FLKGGFKTKSLHIHTRKIPFDDLPREKVALEKFLYKSFERKDKRLRHLSEYSRYPPEDKPISLAYKPSRMGLIGSFTSWAVIWIMFVASVTNWTITLSNSLILSLILFFSFRNALHAPRTPLR